MSEAAGRARGPGLRRLGLEVAVAVVVLLIIALASTACEGPSPTTPGSSPSASLAATATPIVTVTPTGSPVTPNTPIEVHAEGGRLTDVVVTNAAGKRVAGGPTADGTAWTTSEALGYGGTYQVVADAVSPGGTPAHQTGTVTTIDPDARADVTLNTGADGGEVGVGQPISVTFSRAVTDRAAAVKALEVTSNPPQTGAWHWISAKQVDYRPQTYWQTGTTVSVKAALYGVGLGGGVYGASDEQSSFRVHDALVAKADGKTHQMQIFSNGALVKTMDISMGSPDNPTHTGPHVVSSKAPSVVMDSATYGVMPGEPGYYKETVYQDVRISADGEFVHSAPWSVGDQGSDNVSHGCINLSPSDAKWFYDRFSVGDVVEVTNSGGPPLPVWDTWGDWALSWEQWLQDGA